jgi:hypothetical protein
MKNARNCVLSVSTNWYLYGTLATDVSSTTKIASIINGANSPRWMKEAVRYGWRMLGVRKDIDYEDVIGEGLIYDEDWLTPSLAKGEYRYHKLDLSSSIAFYYRLEGSHYTRFEIVLSFDYLDAHAPRSLPILYYGFVNMLDVWEKLGANEEDDSE